MNIKRVQENTYHIYKGNLNDSMLYRYDILTKDRNMEMDKGLVEDKGGFVLHTPFKSVKIKYEQNGEGYRLRIPLSKGERIFGGGDANRKQFMLRGSMLDVHMEDYNSYGPAPVFLSDKGWAIVLNTTYRSTMDCGNTDKDSIIIDVVKGDIDIYLFTADSLMGLVSTLTVVTGRPIMLPKFAYGFTLVENEEINTRGLLWDIKTLRDRNIPCDVIGLEPNWMEKHYDVSIQKKWNAKDFYIPYWQPENTSSDFTFFYPMRKMGMNLSLWLCCDYDLLWAEDQNFIENTKAKTSRSDLSIVDAHFSKGRKMDKITDIKTPWFEHLKKFVDNGAAAFKLDGAFQLMEHPDRLWGGKYLDEEVHNVYPVLYAKQMSNGFKDHTDRRLFLYTADGYVGIQKYAATWAGDTGGFQDTILSLFTYAMCGHTNTSCDMEVSDPKAIHYGFLLPWSQFLCWANWRYPWFLGDETEELIRFYSNLRSSLVPYLYTMAHNAYATGIPILRPLPLVYEGTNRFDDVTNAYMLGDKLYVGVFDMNLRLPEGRWVDYWNGDVYEGDIAYEIPAGRAGALFVKEGSVFVTMKPQKYILEKEHEYIINVFPGKDDTFSLYEDDGYTYDYQENGYCTTTIKMHGTTDTGFSLTVCKREGSFAGRPDNGHDISCNSIPEIKPCGDVHDMQVKIFGAKPASISLDGKAIDFVYEDNAAVFTLPAELHKAGDVVYTITK